MGLLSLGTPLDWDQAKHFSEHVRSHGVAQFLNIWDRVKDRHGDQLLWGDEVGHLSAYSRLAHLPFRPCVRLNTW